MCKTNNNGSKYRPMLRHVGVPAVSVPLAPPTEERKAAISNVPWHLMYNLPQFVSVPQPTVAAPPPPPPAMVAMSPMKPEQVASVSVPMASAPKQRLVRPACVNCRKSKVRCEGGIPCRRCIRLSIDNSCERCEPKKRGRKRKPEMDAARDMAATANSDTALVNEQNKRLKPTLPLRPPEDASRDSIEQFAAFTSQFRTWREKLASDPNTDKTALSRFLFFCSYLSHMVKDYIDAHQSTANQQQMLSDWLCSNLAEDVHKFVENVGTDIVSFPDLCALAGETSSADILQVNVEKQVLKQLPMGVVMLPLHPYPFHADAKAFVNEKMPLLLGYTVQQLKALLSDRDCFPRLLHSSASSKFMARFWDAIADGASTYSCTTAWQHQNGEVVELNGTFSIKYKHGLPVRWTMFLQAGPHDIDRLQRAHQLSLEQAEQVSSDSDEMASPTASDSQDVSGPAGNDASFCDPSTTTESATAPRGSDLSMMLPEEVKSSAGGSFSPSTSSIKDLSTPSSPSVTVPSMEFAQSPAAFKPAYSTMMTSYLPEKAPVWCAGPTDSAVLDMLMAQQPELQFS